MQFSHVVSNIAKINDLRRIAKARLFDVSRLSEDELRTAIIAKETQYSANDLIQESLEKIIFHKDAETRIIAPILLSEILLQAHDYSSPQKESENLVLEWEQEVIDDSNQPSEQTNRQIYNFDFFAFVLEAAWENNNEISQDEKKLIERIRTRLKISTREYRLCEAKLGRFPKNKNELHSREDVNKVRTILQECGLLLTYRDSEGIDHDIIPEEMATSLRVAFGIELKNYGFSKLIAQKYVRNKSYLESVLKKCDISPARSLTLSELQHLCITHIKPSVILGGLTPKDGIEKEQLENWCRELKLAVSGTKAELVTRLIQHYDGLIETTTTDSDERQGWFEYYEEFAARNYGFLRSQQLIEKDQDVDKRFEYATDYLFETHLGHKPLNLAGSEQPDGALSIGDELLLWDNKSKEKECNLKVHLAQFERYFSKSEKKAAALMVIAPSFTAESETEAKLYEIQTGNQISLITAAELKAVALQWSSSKTASDPFPLRYLTTTGRFQSALIAGILK